MGREVWATYAVNDHLQPKAFVADVLLHDRLVIPVPPKDDPAERRRWNDEQWDPDRLDRVLAILGEDLVRRIPWVPWRRDRWKDLRDRWRETQRDNEELAYAFHATRTALTEGLPAHVDAAESVAVYRTLDELERDLGLREADATRVPGAALTAVLGREFLVPDDPGVSDEELLVKAVALAREPDFRNKRTAYHEWRRQFLTGQGTTDAESIARAVQEMHRLVGEEAKALRRDVVQVGTRYAFAVAGFGLALGGVWLAPLAVAGAFVSLGAFVADRIMAPGTAAPSAGALFHDARKHFGWS